MLFLRFSVHIRNIDLKGRKEKRGQENEAENNKNRDFQESRLEYMVGLWKFPKQARPELKVFPRRVIGPLRLRNFNLLFKKVLYFEGFLVNHRNL